MLREKIARSLNDSKIYSVEILSPSTFLLIIIFDVSILKVIYLG